MNYLKSLIKLRNENIELQSGKLLQYIPNDGVYVYFRNSENKAFMIVLNNSDKKKTLMLDYYKESTKAFTSIKEFGQSDFMKIPPQIQLKAKSASIYELTK
jgi:glycosidase